MISQVNFPSWLVQVCFSNLGEKRQLVPLLNLSTTVLHSFSLHASLFLPLPILFFLAICQFFSCCTVRFRAKRSHFLSCAFSFLVLALPQLHHLIPDGELTSIKITRVDPSEPLAISIVGGNETPLVRILIQDIYREGVIARDGRLLPGDMILKVSQLRLVSQISKK